MGVLALCRLMALQGWCLSVEKEDGSCGEGSCVCALTSVGDMTGTSSPSGHSEVFGNLLSVGGVEENSWFCHWKSTHLWLITQSEVVFFYLNIKTAKKKKELYMKVFFSRRDDVPMPHPAGAGRAPVDAVGGLQVGLRVSLEG